MATGRMTCNREKVWRHGLKVLPIKDNIKKGRSMDMDTMFGLTAQTIRESGVRTKKAATAPTHGQMEEGARTPPGRAPRRRAHAPGQAEGAGAEGLRGGTDACAGGWQVRGRVPK